MAAFEATTLEELESLLGEKLETLLELFRAETLRLQSSIGDAIEQGDRESLRLHAHSLKGASSNLGAMDIYGCCVRLEHVAGSAGNAELEVLKNELEVHRVAAEEELAARFAR